MARQILIAGVDRTAAVLLDGFSIEQVLTQAVDTCTFRIQDVQPTEGQEVIVYDGTTKLFAGIIDQVKLVQAEPTGVKIYECSCQDYTYQLDRKLVVETYSNQAADLIVKDIIAKYGAGFTVNHVQANAPVVEEIIFDYKRPSECLKELADYVGWDWFVDYDKDVWFFDPKTLNQPAPMVLEAGGSFRRLRHDVDTQGLRNRVYVRGGSMLSDPWTYSVNADGAARSWWLPHKPHSLSLTVGGVAKTVGIENVDDESTKDFLMNFEEKYVRCSAQTPTPAAGTTLSFTYKYDIDVITVVEDIASQQAIAAVQGGDGVYEHSIVDDSLTTIDAAEAAGQADLREHANPRVKGSFETEISGWAPGQLVTINLPDRGITGTFLVQKVTITPATNALWIWRVEYGGRLLGIADWLQALWKAQQKKKLNETALLHTFHYGAETAKVTDEIGPTIIHRIPALVLPAPSFKRNSVAYKSDGSQVASNTARLELDKFGNALGAVMIEEGTQNPLKNASFEVYTGTTGVADGWGYAYNSTVTPACAVDTVTHRPSGAKSQKIAITASTGAGDAIVYQLGITAAAGQVWTGSWYVTGSATGTGVVFVRIIFRDSVGVALGIYQTEATPTASWQRISVTATAPTGTATVGFESGVRAKAAGDTVTAYFDDAQIEQKSYPTSIIFANDTTTQATRAGEVVTIPTAGVLSPTEGTIEVWAYVDPNGVHSANNPNWSFVLSVVTLQFSPSYAELNQISIRRSPSSTSWGVWFSNSSGQVGTVSLGSITSPDWYSIAVTWKQGVGGYAYLNGILKGSVSSGYLPSSFASVMGIGVWNAAGDNFNLNSYIDDLRISSAARTDAEIATAYASGQPLPVDGNTTYKLNFDNEIMDYVRTPLCGFVVCAA